MLKNVKLHNFTEKWSNVNKTPQTLYNTKRHTFIFFSNQIRLLFYLSLLLLLCYFLRHLFNKIINYSKRLCKDNFYPDIIQKFSVFKGVTFVGLLVASSIFILNSTESLLIWSTFLMICDNFLFGRGECSITNILSVFLSSKSWWFRLSWN